jgi:photosystem II stability/assembly factor-like uncharacterized protein
MAAALALAAQATARPAAAEPWRPLGPPGGTLDFLVFAPSDSRVVYAATDTGSVARSDDGGASWSVASRGLPAFTVLALAVDPGRPRIAFVGNADGVWKTTDGGGTWTASLHRLAGIAVTALAIDPAHPETVYAGAAGLTVHDESAPWGVFRSDDGGRNWVPHRQGLPNLRVPGEAHGLESGIAALAIDAAAPDHLLAAVTIFGPAFEGGTAEIWKSTNGGFSWFRLVGRGLVEPFLIFFAGGFASDPALHTLYMATFPFTYATSDFGEHWRIVGPVDFSPSYITASSPGRLYAIQDGYFLSSADGGVTWTSAGTPPTGVLILAADPRAPDRVLAGSVRGGAFLSTDGGATWSAADEGLLASTITAVAVDPSETSTLYVGTDVGGLQRSADGGSHWQPIDLGFNTPYIDFNLYPLPISSLAVNRRAVWVGVLNGVSRSGDGGATWVFNVPDSCSDVTAISADPSTPTVYAMTRSFSYHDCDLDCNFIESRDDGASWACPSEELFGYSTVAVDPVDPRVVYAAGYNHVQSGLLKSIDRGTTFFLLPARHAAILSLVVSPVDHQILWVGTYEGGVLKSTTGGAGWSLASAGLPAGPVGALVADPQDAATVYAVISAEGVFRSQDGGASWQRLGEGLPRARLNGTLAISAGRQRTLYAGTAGAGLFALPLP